MTLIRQLFRPQTLRRRGFYEKVTSQLPFVIERTGAAERSYDIYSRLLKDRIICLHSDVNPLIASSIVAQLLFLDSQDPEKPIYMYINSPGGTVTDGLAIYDTMQYVKAPVHTVCMGMAASMGALLMAGGTAGNRSALPNARLMIHQPHGGATGQATDIAIIAEEILKTRGRLSTIYAKHTGQPVEKINKVLERDYYMDAYEAVSFGLIDSVIKSKKGDLGELLDSQ